MLKKIVDACLSAPWTTLMCALAVSGGAYWSLRQLPVDVFPDLKVPRVVIQTEAGGMTAEEVEQFITIPMESAMSGIPGVKAVRSSSGAGLSFVWVDFDWNADAMKARFSVSERLAAIRASLPGEAEPEIAPVVSVTGEIMLVALTSPGGAVSPLALRQLAEQDLRSRLLAIPGIGQVVVIGGRLPEYRVDVSPDHLAAFGVTLGEVIAAAQESRTMAGAGYLADVARQEIPLRQTARADTLEELRGAAIPGGGRRRLTLGQVADVHLAGAPRRGSASFNGEDAVVLSIQKAPGGNTLALTRSVDAALDGFSAAALPKGAELHREAYRQADFINLSISNGRDIVRDAAIIVAIVLGLTLLSARTTLIVLASMPLSIALGLLFFPRLGLGVNIMTLGGLAVAVGDVVDNSIIFVEIAWRRLRENAALPVAARRPAVAVIRSASAEIMGSVTFSTVIIVCVFLPLLFLTGLEGQFFAPLGAAYLLAFGASLIVAVTFAPAMCLLLGRNVKGRAGTRDAGDGLPVRILKRLYRPLLRFSVRHSLLVCILTAAVSAGMIALAATFGTSFLAPFREDCYTVFVNTPPGTSLDETERATAGAIREIQSLEGVMSVTRRTGRAEKDEHAEPVSASELVVRVDLACDTLALQKRIAGVVNAIPGVSTLVGHPIAHRISSVLSGTESELAINIYGDDLAVLRQAAAEAKAELDRIPEVADARANREVLVDALRIRYRMEDLARHGLTLKDAGEQVSAAFNGLCVGRVAANRKSWDVVVRLEDGERNSVRAVPEFRLSATDGSRPRLADVADVFREEAPNLIVRDNARRKALISCNVAEGASVGGLVRMLRRRIDPIAHRLGCTVGYGGSYEAQQSASRRLGWLSVALAAGLSFALARASGGMRNSALAMLNVPLSLIGAVAAVFIAAPGSAAANIAALFGRGAYVPPILSVASLVGLVTVAGFVLRSGLLLVNRYRELREAGAGVEEAAMKGSEERVVPILMTSLTTVFGLIPIVMAGDRPGGELLVPLAVVQFGGLIGATFLNLLAVPAAYRLMNRESKINKV